MIRWGLSILDWRHHAVDDRRRHPSGVYQAECGHPLLVITRLREEVYGRPCGECADLQVNRATEASEEVIAMSKPGWRPSDVPLCGACQKREMQEKGAYESGDMTTYLCLAGVTAACVAPGCKQST